MKITKCTVKPLLRNVVNGLTHFKILAANAARF